MFCPECGTKLPDDALFCTECGTRLDDSDLTTDMPGSGQPASQPTQAAPGAASQEASGAGFEPTTAMPRPDNAQTSGAQYAPGQEPEQPKRSHKKAVIAVVIAVVVIGLAAGGGFLWWKLDQDRKAQEQDAKDHERIALTLNVDAPDLDTSAGSLIPVLVSGTDLDGNEVEETQYIDEDGESLELLQGEYALSFPASPFAEDGSLYNMPDDDIQITVDGDTENLDDAGVVALSPIDPAEVTDEDIDAAFKYARDGGCESEQDAEALRDLATEARDTAVEAQEQARERERAAANTIAADSYTIQVPSYWQGKVTWEVTGDTVTFYSKAYPDRAVATVYWKEDTVAIAGDIASFGVALAESSTDGVVALSGPNYSYLIPWALRTNSTDPNDYYTKDEANLLIDLQSGGSHSYDDALADYDAGTYGTIEDCSRYLEGAFNAQFR